MLHAQSNCNIVRINAPNGPHATCELVWLRGAAPSPASSPHPVSFVCLLLFCVPSASELGAAEWGGEGREQGRGGAVQTAKCMAYDWIRTFNLQQQVFN